MKTILVIEDDRTVRQNILTLLKAEGFQAVGAEHGLVGLEKAQALHPDLIICDVMMPYLDGFGVLKKLRQIPATSMIPVIFLSARTERQDVRRGMTLGADDYVTKPFTRSELLEAIATRLAKQSAVMELQQQLESLQASQATLDSFVNTAAHELRSPVVNMKMAIEILQVVPDPDRRQQYLDLLQSECDRQVELLNDLLDLQRLETPLAPSDLEPLPLHAWLPTIVEPFELRAQQRQQQLRMQLPNHIPLLVTERHAFNRILTELLNNACKYTTPGGQICLTVQSLPTGICLCLSNEAEIPPEALPHLFERFYRVPNGDRWQQGGTGLGLALVQKLVERLRGTIEIRSDQGWTSVVVQLPNLGPSSETDHPSMSLGSSEHQPG